ncbi:MAG: hypothetical protein ACRDLQ_05885 [Solirubrobacterales bacterium]
MHPLNAYLAYEIMDERMARAERYRRLRTAREQAPRPHYDSVTIRRTTPDDRGALERLAQLEGGVAPAGTALVAEVEERIVAARWLGDDVTLADPFLPTTELVSLLETRARHLGARPRLLTHPLRRAASAVRRGPAALRH